VNSQAGPLHYIKTRIADFHITLIELHVVVAIIAILASMLLLLPGPSWSAISGKTGGMKQ